MTRRVHSGAEGKIVTFIREQSVVTFENRVSGKARSGQLNGEDRKARVDECGDVLTRL